MRVTEPYTIFLRTLPSGKQVYYYQFRYEDGRRSTPKTTGCDTMAKARRYCQMLYNSGKLDTAPDMRFRDFAAGFFDPDGAFCKWKAVNGNPLKPETARRYNTSLLKHLMPFFSERHMKDITRDVCKKWVIWANERWSPKSVNNAQGVLNLILQTAVEKDIITRNPLYKLGFRKIPRKTCDMLTEAELNSLYCIGWPTESHRQMFLLAAITGMRIGEIVALKKTDIKDGYLDVHADFSDRFGLQETTKTSMSRYVPFPSGFEFPESKCEWVFSKDGISPIKGHSVYNALTRRCEEIGIDTKARGITVHSLRNFFISHMQKNNVPEPKIRAVVGHADTTMTDLYTYWTPDMFPEVYEAQLKLFNFITGSDA